jgi:hypothetical protein
MLAAISVPKHRPFPLLDLSETVMKMRRPAAPGNVCQMDAGDIGGAGRRMPPLLFWKTMTSLFAGEMHEEVARSAD